MRAINTIAIVLFVLTLVACAKPITKSIDAPLKDLEGNDFVVGVGPMSTKFVVSAPPHTDGDDWRIIVDGIELEKKR